MRIVHIHFFKQDLFGGCNIDVSTREMNLDMSIIKELAQKSKCTFTDVFSHVVSHEIIHQIIYDEIDNSTSTDFDNICYAKHRDLKYWIGGVGGQKS